jgi:hypothetical protein
MGQQSLDHDRRRSEGKRRGRGVLLVVGRFEAAAVGGRADPELPKVPGTPAHHHSSLHQRQAKVPPARDLDGGDRQRDGYPRRGRVHVPVQGSRLVDAAGGRQEHRRLSAGIDLGYLRFVLVIKYQSLQGRFTNGRGRR